MRVQAVILGILALVVIAVMAQDPSYDHQTKTYVPQFKPVTKNNAFISIMPFFSPDHSIDSAVEMIQNATQTLDISTPGFSSWIGCTYFEEGCVGCPLDRQLNETFPVFPALLNAAHRGVRIRLMTNDYKTPTCKGKIAPMDWLYANGVDIRYYTSTTFTHSKYMSTDGKQTSISSVNFSQASFMKNREAGVVLGDGCDDMIAMASAVFEYDWAQAYAYTFDPSQYTQAELDMIRSPLPYTVVMPPQPNIPGAFVTPQPAWITGSVQLATIFTSPDFAHDTVMPLLSGATSSVDIMIYQITDDSLCQQVISLYQRGINVRLLVSNVIYDETDWKAAQACYGQIYSAGLRFRKTPKYYNYSHQKFFIVDNSTVSVSTGNFSPSDYPQNPPFPPYGQPGWQSVNRDYSLIFTDADTVAVFETVLSQDWQRGTDWTPSSTAFMGSETL